MRQSPLLLLLSLPLWLSPGAHAQVTKGEVYTGLGFPGLMVGYAHAVDALVTARVDYASMGSRSQDGFEEGINYQGRARFARVGVFADWFPWNNGFRVTGGVTVNQMKVELRADLQPGDTLTVGNATVTVPGSGYRFNVDIKAPRVTPYIGIGWGHHRREPGWGVIADLGASIGRAQVEIDTNLTDAGVSQADIDQETRQLRDGVGKVRFVPQATLGISYRY